LPIHVQPRAARNEFVGLHDGCLKIRLTAPPVEGAANEALLRFLADWLDLPRRQIALVSGPGSRRKLVEADGLTPQRLAALGVNAALLS
jgi:uncharacterized protein (TIGR00251 family)